VASWDRPFAEPIELPGGKKVITLRDAAHYITKLPKQNTMPMSGRPSDAGSLVGRRT